MSEFTIPKDILKNAKDTKWELGDNPQAPKVEEKATEGSWPKDSIQRAFVEGAAWWQFHKNGSTMFGSEKHEAEDEAVKRYGEPGERQ